MGVVSLCGCGQFGSRLLMSICGCGQFGIRRLMSMCGCGQFGSHYSSLLSILTTVSFNTHDNTDHLCVHCYREGGVSPCSLILGLIYIQCLAKLNPAYMTNVPPQKLFLISLVRPLSVLTRLENLLK